MLIEDSIQNEYLDNAHFDIECAFSRTYAKIGELLVVSASGLDPFVVGPEGLRTPTYSLTCMVTAEQDSTLRKLYAATVHPRYIDQRSSNLIDLSWQIGGGDTSRRQCYLMGYQPPTSVDYGNAQLLQAILTLRPV